MQRHCRVRPPPPKSLERRAPGCKIKASKSGRNQVEIRPQAPSARGRRPRGAWGATEGCAGAWYAVMRLVLLIHPIREGARAPRPAVAPAPGWPVASFLSHNRRRRGRARTRRRRRRRRKASSLGLPRAGVAAGGVSARRLTRVRRSHPSVLGAAAPVRRPQRARRRPARRRPRRRRRRTRQRWRGRRSRAKRESPRRRRRRRKRKRPRTDRCVWCV